MELPGTPAGDIFAALAHQLGLAHATDAVAGSRTIKRCNMKVKRVAFFSGKMGLDLVIMPLGPQVMVQVEFFQSVQVPHLGYWGAHSTSSVASPLQPFASGRHFRDLTENYEH